MKHLAIVLISFFSLLSVSFAQGGWQNIYPIQSNTPYGDGIDAVKQTPDGGYILAGASEVNSSASQNRVVKVNDQGIIQWSTSYASVGPYSWATNIELSPLGGYYVEGYRTNPSTFAREVYLQRIDANGNQLWLNVYPQAQVATKGDVTNDGGYIQIGYYDNNGIQDTLSVIKTDASGNLEWLNKYPNTGTGIERIPTSIIQTSNNEFVVAGYKDQGFGGLNFLWRLNAQGDSLWQSTYGVTMNHPEYIGQVLELQDGSLVALANDALTFGANDFYLFKTDASGNLLWDRHYQQINAFGTHLDATTDGGFILTGYQNVASSYKVILIKTDESGTQQWLKTYNGLGTGSYKPYCVQQTSDGGYVVGAAKIQGAYTRLNMYLIKTDSLGEIYGNTLQGYVFADADADCNLTNGEHPFSNWLIKAEGAQTFYTSTNEDGFYWLRVDTGNYQLTLQPPSNSVYWETSSCANDTVQLSIPTNLSTIETSFPQTADEFCPLLSVDLGTPFLRRCFNNTYVIHYCNSGTSTAENAYVDVAFDDFLSLDTSSITGEFSLIDVNTYRFQIGNVEIGACGSIHASVYVSCEAVLSQTHCSSASIFPNSNCLEPLWTGAFLELDAECRNDSAVFIIHNTGASMTQPSNFTIYQNGTIIDLGSIQLAANEVAELSYLVVSNAAYRIDLHQPQGLPSILGDPIASIAVFACLQNSSNEWVTQFSNYDGSPFIDVDCRQNIGAYDPNDKQASPIGYGIEHYIAENTDLEYLIRFQNTGTDTAFTIVIRDTISAALDVSTFQAGAASHAYSWRYYGEGVQAVEFTFNTIMLPDSFVNEPASHGFIKYRIKQLRDNPIGTIINNTAAIYFDFNEPIFTNTTFHEIGADYIEEVLITEISPSVEGNNHEIRMYPNPFNSQTTIELPLGISGSLKLMDVQGRVVKSLSSASNTIYLSREGLSKGLYLYVIEVDGLPYSTGKVIVH